MTTEESRDYLRALGVAFLLGVGVGLASVAFLFCVHHAEALLWDDLPDALGYDTAPWWLLVPLLTVGGVLAALAMRLKGHGGHHPVDGFGGPPITIDLLPSVLLAAFASLAFGAVLGPEAPLMAIGSALGLWAAGLLKVSPGAAPLFAAAGSLAAVGTILGNPLMSVVLVAELMVVRAGPRVFVVLLPGLVAAGAGSLIFLGLGDFVGIGEVELAIPGVPVPETLSVADVLWAPVIGVLTAVVLVVVLRGMHALRPRLSAHPPLAVLPPAGAVVGGFALLYSLTGEDASDLLFSGQSELPTIITWTSLGTLVAYVVLKAAAYVVSAGAGFRGGLIFPMIAIAVALGTALSQVLPGLSLAAALAAAIAASLAAGMRLPISGVAFALMLMGAAGLETTPVAIFGAATAFVVAQAVHNREKAGGLPGGSDDRVPERTA